MSHVFFKYRQRKHAPAFRVSPAFWRWVSESGPFLFPIFLPTVTSFFTMTSWVDVLLDRMVGLALEVRFTTPTAIDSVTDSGEEEGDVTVGYLWPLVSDRCAPG